MQTFSHGLQKKRKHAFETGRSQKYFSVLSVGCCTSYIISRLPVNLKFYIISNTLPTKFWSVSTAFRLPPESWSVSVVAEASFVYIVWLIACKEHNELLIQCAPSPAATVCTLNVIRDSASCPWWAALSSSYTRSCIPACSTACHCRSAG